MTATATARARGGADRDAGSALVEFCVLAVLMLVPVVYLVATLGRVQAGAFATQGAAREAARAFVTAPDDDTGRRRADLAAAVALADQGFDDPRQARISIDCGRPSCLAPGTRVRVHASLQVGLPAVPGLVRRVVPARIVMGADQVVTVGRFDR